MYENYFGFEILPFSVTPDPRFFYDTADSRKAMTSLRYGIEGRKGLIVITGEPGTGKTRLIKDFVQTADEKVRSVFISAPQLVMAELLPVVLSELGILPASDDPTGMTRQLKNYLVEQLQMNYVVALLVDEAHELSDESLEELRLLSNLETNKDKLIQIVLVGQPKLEERLEQPELRQLRQRIALRCRLVPLKDEQVGSYIQTRLKAAGFKQPSLFDPKAVAKIAQYSSGIPRRINMICDSALLYCYGFKKKIVSADMVEEVARDLQLSVQRSSEKLNATQYDSEKNAGWVINEPSAVASVSQRPLAEQIQDVFKLAEPRRTGIHRQLSPASLATGFILGVLAAAGAGAYFYSKPNQTYLTEIPARVPEDPRSERLNSAAAKPETLDESRPAEVKDVQPTVDEKPSISPRPREESDVAANAPAIIEPGKIGSAPAADAADQPLEKQTVKTDEKNEKTIQTASKGTINRSTNARIEFDIQRAIAKHMIRGVHVSVVDGTVVLGGRVDTENQKIAAAKAASNVPGVKSVRDRIIVSHDAAS